MPYRTPALLLMGLAGAVAVVGLVLIGIDVYAAKQRGPRWKRRLLGAGLAVLGGLGVWFARPKPQIAICYAPIPMEVGSAIGLRDRLPLLEKMIEDEKLDPRVARTALATAEVDLGRITMEPRSGPGMSREGMTAIRDQAIPVIERLRARLGEPTSLEDATEWKTLAAVWDEAAAALVVKPGKFAFDLKTKERLIASIEKLLSTDLARLVGTGLLSAPEARLLQMDLGRILDGVKRTRASGNDPTPTCYGPVPSLPPARKSARDLGFRVEALKAITIAGKLHPAALQRALVSLREDLAILDEAGSYAGMDSPERAKAEKTRDAAKAEVEKLKKLLDAEEAGRK